MGSNLITRKPARLTGRERKLLRLLVRGLSLAEIAEALRLAVTEVEHLRSSICDNLRLSEEPAVQAYAEAIGLVRRNSDDNPGC